MIVEVGDKTNDDDAAAAPFDSLMFTCVHFAIAKKKLLALPMFIDKKNYQYSIVELETILTNTLLEMPNKYPQSIYASFLRPPSLTPMTVEASNSSIHNIFNQFDYLLFDDSSSSGTGDDSIDVEKGETIRLEKLLYDKENLAKLQVYVKKITKFNNIEDIPIEEVTRSIVSKQTKKVNLEGDYRFLEFYNPVNENEFTYIRKLTEIDWITLVNHRETYALLGYDQYDRTVRAIIPFDAATIDAQYHHHHNKIDDDQMGRFAKTAVQRFTCSSQNNILNWDAKFTHEKLSLIKTDDGGISYTFKSSLESGSQKLIASFYQTVKDAVDQSHETNVHERKICYNCYRKADEYLNETRLQLVMTIRCNARAQILRIKYQLKCELEFDYNKESTTQIEKQLKYFMIHGMNIDRITEQLLLTTTNPNPTTTEEAANSTSCNDTLTQEAVRLLLSEGSPA